MNIQTRPATAEDAKTISALNAQVHDLHAAAEPRFFKPASDLTFPPMMVQDLMETPGHFFYLAVVDGQVAGYVYFEIRQLEENPFRHALEQAYIHQIGVRPEFQGSGCGKRLMALVKDIASERGLQNIALDTWGFNQQAQAFFASQGFEPFNYRYWLWL
jgi:ribosomal protein S18 acetylase RimI-like enzyme